MINQLQHIGIGVTSLEKSLDFYQNKLGFDFTIANHQGSHSPMNVYTNGEDLIRDTVLIANMQGGCFIKIINCINHEAVKSPTPIRLGDIGINFIKTHLTHPPLQFS